MDDRQNKSDLDNSIHQGSRDIPLAQRIGTRIFGVVFMLSGLGFAPLAWNADLGGAFLYGLSGAATFAIGFQLFRYASPRKTAAAKDGNG